LELDRNNGTRSTVLQTLRRQLDALPPHTAWTLAIRIAAVGIEFLCLLVLARVFKADAYGTYALVMSGIAIAAVPATVGFDRLLVRELAAYHASNDWPRLKGLLRRGVQVVGIASLVVAAALWAGTRMLPGTDSALAAQSLQFAIVLVPILAFARVRQATLQGFGHVVAGQLPEAIVQPTILMALAGITAVSLQLPRAAEFALVLQVIASTSALVLGAVLQRRYLPPGPREAYPVYLTRQWLTTGLNFMWLVGMSAVLTNIDTILVGALMSPADAGVYRVASQLAMFVGLPLTAVSVAMAPGMAAMHATGRRVELQSQSRAAARLIGLGAGGITFLIAIIGPQVLQAFGPQFGRGFDAALVLAVAYLFHSAMATSGYQLLMSGHERLVAVLFSVGTLLNMAGLLLLVPLYGLVGAAIAGGVSLCFVSAALALLARRLVGINATLFSTVS
jgi:O-antigen/teichoic acid export membrane protein